LKLVNQLTVSFVKGNPTTFPMTIQDLSFPDPQQNLDKDEELLRLAEKTSTLPESVEVLRFWESPAVFVVLGRAGKEGEDVDLDACRRDQVPVLRRSSGGGTVVQGPGCLNFSFILSKSRHPELAAINRSYQVILEQVLKALKTLGIDGEFRPVCDLVLKRTEKKFSGNAQRRGREFILHHGTILYDFDLDLISRYLKMPPKMPEYRRKRPHADFVTNIPARPADIKRVLAQAFDIS
jgi:lipoate-protein ligase A